MSTGSSDDGLGARPAIAKGARAPFGLRRGALLLLLVFLGGLNITSLTQEWLGATLDHGHIFLGGRGYIPHSHPGDGTARSGAALAIVASPPGTGAGAETSARAGAISLRPFAAADVVSGAVGLARLVGCALPSPSVSPCDYPVAAISRPAGERPEPVPRPPQRTLASALVVG